MINILIGSDLTSNSENAFMRAIQLARLTSAKLHVVHVNRQLDVPGGESATLALRTELEDRVARFIQTHSQLPGIDYDVYLGDRGRVYEVLNQYAGSTRADLVIIGRSKRAGEIPGSVLLTTGQIVSAADHPVLVVTQPASKGYQRILLEAEFSTSSARALATVSGFGPDIELTLLQRSIDASALGGFLKRLRIKARKRRHETIVDRAVRTLRKQGISAERLSIQVVAQEPVDILLDALGETRYDIVVFSDMHRKLANPALRDRILKAVPVAACDMLFKPR